MSVFDYYGEQAGIIAAKKALKVSDNTKKNFAIARGIFGGETQSLIDLALNDLLGDYIKPINYRLLGGIPMDEVIEVYNELQNTNFSKANIWHIAIEDVRKMPHSFNNINLFANDVSYSPITISGERKNVGSGSYDTITGAEGVEMKITAKDNEVGELKRWLKERAEIMCKSNGLFGLPIEYVIRVTVTHAFCSQVAEGAAKAVRDQYIMRLSNVDYNKDRRNDTLEDVSFSLSQFDTFTGII